MTERTLLDRRVYVLEHMRVPFMAGGLACTINLDGAENRARLDWLAAAEAAGFDVRDVTAEHPSSLASEVDEDAILALPAGAVEVRADDAVTVLLLTIEGLSRVTARRVTTLERENAPRTVRSAGRR